MAEREARITVLRNYGGFRVDTVGELEEIVHDLFGPDGWEPFVDSLREDFGIPGEAQAGQNLRNAGLVNDEATEQPRQQRRTYDQPNRQREQSRQGNQKFQTGDEAPPTLDYPGPCDHGERVYFANHPSNGKAWPRWECALKWSPQNKNDRCKTLNAN